MPISRATFSYLRNILDPAGLKKVKADLLSGIRQSGLEFEAIAVSGYSGAIPGAVVAAALGKPLVVVRKKREEEPSHGNDVEAGQGDFTYIIVDDFVSSGATIQRIEKSLAENKRVVGTLVGIFLWSREDDSTFVSLTGNKIPEFGVEDSRLNELAARREAKLAKIND